VGEVVYAAATPWIVLGYGAGRSGSSWWRSGLLGAAVLLAGLSAYYGWLRVAHDVDGSQLWSGTYQAPLYLVAGATIGAVCGVLGGLSRSRVAALAELTWAGLVAVPIVDAIVDYRFSGEAGFWTTVAALAPMAGFIGAWAIRSGARASVLAVAVPLATGVLYAGELIVLRQVFGLLN